LCPTSEKKDSNLDRKAADVFEYIVDVYMVAAVIGLERGLREIEDKGSKDEVRIFANAVHNRKLNLEFIFQLVMLVDNSQKLTADEKIARAFKNDDAKANFELFSSYVRGGITWLYEQFTAGATTHDEYIAKIHEIVENFREENGIE
jgi:hypothetical protein